MISILLSVFVSSASAACKQADIKTVDLILDNTKRLGKIFLPKSSNIDKNVDALKTGLLQILELYHQMLFDGYQTLIAKTPKDGSKDDKLEKSYKEIEEKQTSVVNRILEDLDLAPHAKFFASDLGKKIIENQRVNKKIALSSEEQKQFDAYVKEASMSLLPAFAELFAFAMQAYKFIPKDLTPYQQKAQEILIENSAALISFGIEAVVLPFLTEKLFENKKYSKIH